MDLIPTFTVLYVYRPSPVHPTVCQAGNIWLDGKVPTTNNRAHLARRREQRELVNIRRADWKALRDPAERRAAHN